ncbi:hypothetical protein BI317_01055 [Xanthomonas hortorum pv. gardneri]|nr:hypothetical protein BI317_01055 [Xanthomonas hortorum pv. gardneri]ASW47356.1 hypothetical protein XJ27_16350 [Xanthomonas hortorum]
MDANKNYIDVANKLGLMYRELQAIKTHLIASNFSEIVFLPTISKIESAISPQILHAHWGDVKRNLTEDVYTSLSYCSEILPDEERSITEEDFLEIVALVNDLEMLLKDTALPDHLVNLIRHHIELIEIALSNYPITGAQGLRNASKQAIGDFVESADEINANKDSLAIKTFGKLWKKVNSVVDMAIKADKLAQFGDRAIKLIEQFI